MKDESGIPATKSVTPTAKGTRPRPKATQKNSSKKSLTLYRGGRGLFDGPGSPPIRYSTKPSIRDDSLSTVGSGYTRAMEKATLLLNPSSGGGRSGKSAKGILDAIKTLGIEAEVHFSKSADHLRQLSINALAQPQVPLLCAGGDGTNRIIIDSMLQASEGKKLPVLGLIPSGRGNSFVRDLGITTLTDAFEAIRGGKTLKVDVGRVTAEEGITHFINCLGAGFISDVGKFALRLRALGNISYTLGVLWETLMLRRHHLELEIDGRRVKEDLLFLEISNSKMTGGTMLIAPEAQIDDGQLDIVMVGRMGRISLLNTFPKIYSGTHGLNPAVSFLRGRKIKISSAIPEALLPDGDLDFATPVEIEVLPKAISCYRHPAGGGKS